MQIRFSSADKIETTVDSGVVTLTGTVNRLRIKSRAALVVQEIVGVRRVVNELKVEYEWTWRSKPVPDSGRLFGPATDVAKSAVEGAIADKIGEVDVSVATI